MLRRKFLSSTMLSAAGLGTLSGPSVELDTPASRVFNIVSYGALPDGKTNNARAIQSAIEDAAKAGGTVYVPQGSFVTGGLVLRSRVRLHVDAGAVLLGSGDVADYEYHAGPPVHGDANGRHLIYARDCDDIEISGLGTIDGHGPSFWARTERIPPSADDLWRDVIAMDWKPATNMRPSPMLEFAYCKNLRIHGITLANPAGWTLRVVGCKSVFFTGMRVRNPVYAPNTDGMDITCSENVFVSDCDIEAGDDAICLKSENPYGEVTPTRNVVVTNCVLTTSSNGFKLGTAGEGSFENIVFSNSVIYNKDVPYNERVIAGVAIEMADGGSIDGVLVSGIVMQNVRTPIFVRLEHRHSSVKKTSLKNVTIRGVDASGAILTSSITGMPDAPVEAITLEDLRIRTQEGGHADWGTEVPEVPKDYPEARMFGRLPCYGIYVRHAKGVRLRNVELIADTADSRPALVCDDVADLVVSGFEVGPGGGIDPVIRLQNTARAFVHGSRAPAGTKVFLRVEGARSGGIVLAGNDLSTAQHAVTSGKEVSAEAVTFPA
jgi:polygalacturonase